MDATVVLPFDAVFAAQSPEHFIEVWLRERLGASAVVTGEDFTFGKDRRGTTAMLASLPDIDAETIGAVEAEGETVSSTRIRKALRYGEMEGAARLLTRPYAIRGTVQHGDKLGRTIGYPTANIALGGYLRPAYGVYAVRGRLPDGRVVDGAANLGVRPQFDPPKELLEPYFFDFSGDLYGQEIEVELVHFLRPEAKFDSLDALTAQIERDCGDARAALQSSPGGQGNRIWD
jgi:riboflavin kinase / FMN adenylyltransferase